MTLWLKVTRDKYEHPLAVADSVEELARMCGTTVNTIRSTIAHYNSGQLKKRKYIKLEIEDDDDGIKQ